MVSDLDSLDIHDTLLLAARLKDSGHLEEALEAAYRAVRLDRGNAEAHNLLGQILHALGSFTAAVEAYERAAAQPGPVAERARVNLAVLLMETGRNEEAMAAFDAVLRDYPHSASAWFNRADLKKFIPDDVDILAMQALLASGRCTPGERILLHFALGKALLDSGADAEAFEHFHLGNRLKRATIEFDCQTTAAWMKSIAEAYAPSLFERLASSGHVSALPLFVIGMPRSGTTLIEQILAAHPAVEAGGELPTLQRLVDDLPQGLRGLGLLDSDYFTRLGSAYILENEPLASGKARLTDKMPANFLHAGLIRLILPQARIIHCRRDPVDTCLSCYTKLFTAGQPFAYDLSELGRFHLAYQDLMAHWRAVLPAEMFIEIDYEALVADFEGEARTLLEKLGLPWSEGVLRFFEHDRPIRTASVNQVRQPLYGGSAGRWRRYAPHLEPLLRSLGIET